MLSSSYRTLITRPARVGLRWTASSASSAQKQTKRLHFEGQTALVTGAGRGLGREYALLLASRGANVIVNDFGGSQSGAGSASESAADSVVAEINKLYPGVKALANYESVSCDQAVKRLLEASYQAFGGKRIDILINNAGILRDKSFAKMTLEDWDLVQNVHLRGSFLVSHAAWPIMRQQNYGKIIMTSSTSGLYGNFGQANYSAAKMGLIGLANTLAIEGKPKNILVNTIVPMAASRMTQDIIPPELASRLKPADVAPLVGWLCHPECKTTGAVVEAAGRWFGRYRLQRSSGKYLSSVRDKSASLEQLAADWRDICNLFDGATQVESFNDHLADIMRVFQENKEEN